MPSWRERDAEAFGRNALPKITAVAAMISPSVLDIDRLSTQRREHPPETVLDRDLWLPPEHLAGPGDVGLPLLGIVDWQRLEDDLAPGAADANHRLRQPEQGQLLWISEVDGQVLSALRE